MKGGLPHVAKPPTQKNMVRTTHVLTIHMAELSSLPKGCRGAMSIFLEKAKLFVLLGFTLVSPAPWWFQKKCSYNPIFMQG